MKAPRRGEVWLVDLGSVPLWSSPEA